MTFWPESIGCTKDSPLTCCYVLPWPIIIMQHSDFVLSCCLKFHAQLTFQAITGSKVKQYTNYVQLLMWVRTSSADQVGSFLPGSMVGLQLKESYSSILKTFAHFDLLTPKYTSCKKLTIDFFLCLTKVYHMCTSLVPELVYTLSCCLKFYAQSDVSSHYGVKGQVMIKLNTVGEVTVVPLTNLSLTIMAWPYFLFLKKKISVSKNEVSIVFEIINSVLQSK